MSGFGGEKERTLKLSKSLTFSAKWRRRYTRENKNVGETPTGGHILVKNLNFPPVL